MNVPVVPVSEASGVETAGVETLVDFEAETSEIQLEMVSDAVDQAAEVGDVSERDEVG